MRLRRGTSTEDYLDSLSLSSDSLSSDKSPLSFGDSDSDQGAAAASASSSQFAIQEHLARLVSADPHNVQAIVALPAFVSSSTPDSIDDDGLGEGASSGSSSSGRDVWLYEQLRRLSHDLSHPFVVSLQEACTRETCPEMKAGEWLYLCAAHATANETECCAIDYITHTLDGAVALLNSSRYFPSRTSIPTTSLKHFTSIARRLYRIFAHAWYHHRDVFSACESETSLYERFLALSTEYDLVSPDLLVIPGQQGDGEGGSSSSSSDSSEDEQRDHDEEEVEDANPDELEHKLHEEEEEEEGEHAADVEQEAGVEHPSAESTQKGEGKEEDEEGRKDAEEEGEGASDHAAPDAPSAGEATEDAEEGKKVEASESQTSTSAAKALDVNEALVE